MEENKSKNNTPSDAEIVSDRAKELYHARIILEKLEARLGGNRFRSYENDDNFLKFLRVYDQHLLTINTIRRDVELEQIQKQIDELKEQQKERS